MQRNHRPLNIHLKKLFLHYCFRIKRMVELLYLSRCFHNIVNFQINSHGQCNIIHTQDMFLNHNSCLDEHLHVFLLLSLSCHWHIFYIVRMRNIHLLHNNQASSNHHIINLVRIILAISVPKLHHVMIVLIMDKNYDLDSQRFYATY